MEHVAARAGETGKTVGDEAVVAARLATLQTCFGAAFGEEGLPVAREAIVGGVNRDHILRQVPLGNADEPIGSFVPVRDKSEG